MPEAWIIDGVRHVHPAGNPSGIADGPGPGHRARPRQGRDDRGGHRPGRDRRGLRNHPDSRSKCCAPAACAIASGHPPGATGGMLIGTVLDALERQDETTGLVAPSIAGGTGITTFLERI